MIWGNIHGYSYYILPILLMPSIIIFWWNWEFSSLSFFIHLHIPLKYHSRSTNPSIHTHTQWSSNHNPQCILGPIRPKQWLFLSNYHVTYSIIAIYAHIHIIHINMFSFIFSIYSEFLASPTAWLRNPPNIEHHKYTSWIIPWIDFNVPQVVDFRLGKQISSSTN